MYVGKKNKFYNPLIEAIDEPVFVFDGAGKYMCANAPAADILRVIGYRTGHLPENINSFVQVVRFSSSPESGHGVTIAGTPYRVARGEYEDGQILRLVPLMENVHLMRLSRSLDAMPWGLMTLAFKAGDAYVSFCNRRAGDFLEMAPARVIGMSAADVFASLGVAQDISLFTNGNETGFYDHQMPEGSPAAWYRIHFSPYVSEEPLCLVVLEDLTQEKMREEQYVQARRMEALGQLAGGVAHDFNNLLSVIDGYARMGRNASGGDKTLDGYMERISQTVRRGAELTSRLLAYGQQRDVCVAAVDLGAVVREQEALLRPLMEAPIAFRVQIEDDILVGASHDYLAEILMNLCINAREAMKEGGQLCIKAGKMADGVQAFMSVSDTGEGMPPDVAERIFDPFFTTKDRGTGLGLSMVKGLVQEFGGEISVDTKVGEGTAITVTMKLATNEKPQRTEKATADAIPYLEGVTALLAEDEPDLLNIIASMLEEMGVKVLRAQNGTQAMALQEKYSGRIDLLLTDVMMPELNGVKLAEIFKGARPESGVVFMSGYGERGQEGRVSLPENAQFIAKPVDFSRLGRTMQTMVDEERSLRRASG